MLKLPQGANTVKNKPNGQSPIKKLKKIWPKLRFPTPFSKIPKSSKPRKFSTQSKEKRKKEKIVENIR